MAKHSKTIPARRARASDGALLIRSAESLGRMIGLLQRQLDGASRKVPGASSAASRTDEGRGNGNRSRPVGKTAGSAAPAKGRDRSGVSKPRPAAAGTSKSATVKKDGRSRSARRNTAKASGRT